MALKAACTTAAATVGLAVLLGACGGKPQAAPTPVSIPSISTSRTPASLPAIASISVRPTTTTVAPVEVTTEPPPPPPPPAEEPPVQTQPAPPPVEPTEPDELEVALHGFPCHDEGATAVDPAGRPLVCEKGRRGRLSWGRP